MNNIEEMAETIVSIVYTCNPYWDGKTIFPNRTRACFFDDFRSYRKNVRLKCISFAHYHIVVVILQVSTFLFTTQTVYNVTHTDIHVKCPIRF